MSRFCSKEADLYFCADMYSVYTQCHIIIIIMHVAHTVH